jgi:hypothetical protein
MILAEGTFDRKDAKKVSLAWVVRETADERFGDKWVLWQGQA